jgi:hypothetical protein
MANQMWAIAVTGVCPVHPGRREISIGRPSRLSAARADI